MKHPADGKSVVVENGQRASGLHADESSAQAEAARRRKQLAESEAHGHQPAKVEVKTNLYG